MDTTNLETQRLLNVLTSKRINLLTFLIIGSIFIITPSVYFPSFVNPSESSKTLFLLSASSIFLILFSVKVFSHKTLILKTTSLDLWLLILTLFIILNRYFFQSEIIFSLRFYDLLGMGILYIAMRIIPITYFPFIFLSVLVGALLQGLIGLMQLLDFIPSGNTYFPIVGSFFNPGPFAGYLAVIGMISVSFITYREEFTFSIMSRFAPNRKAKNKLIIFFTHTLPYICLALVLILLPALRSRAAWIALFLGGLACCISKHNWKGFLQKLTPKLKSIYFTCFTLSILLLSMIAFNLKQGSTSGRILIYKATVELVTENLFLGVGFDRFQSRFMEYQAKYLNHETANELNIYSDNTVYAFSEPLQLLSETGLPGLILWMMILYNCVRSKVVADLKFYKNIAITLLLSLLGFSLFTYSSGHATFVCRQI